MKKNLLFVLLLSATTCLAQKYTGDSWAKVKSNGGSLSVLYYAQPGLIEKDAGGKMKGVCVDILNDFSAFVQDKYGKKLLINYVGQDQNFPSFLATAQNTPNLLGVTNVTITEERKKIMKFTPPFMSNPLVLLTHKDGPTLSKLEDIGKVLSGYSAKVITGSTHVLAIEKIKKEHMPSLKIAQAGSSTEILEQLTPATKLFTILDFTEYVEAVRRQMPVKRQSVNLGGDEELAFIMAKQTDWDIPWNEFLTADYRKGVRYRKIIVDNLGANFLGILK
jgi:ABC-type amino acid transport substrate-binding protein